VKIFELRRLNFGLAVKVVLAYTGEKLLHVSMLSNQKELIEYFNALIRLDLFHKSDLGKHYLVKSADFGDFCFRKPFSSDYKVYQQVFVDKEYLLLAQLIEKHCPGKSIAVLDGGANIGLTTIYLNHYLKDKKDIRYILVEPFEDNLQVAQSNIGLKGIKQVFFEKAGIYNRKSFLRIDHDFRDKMEWSIQIVESSEPTSLNAIEINDIVKKYSLEHLDVLKLDIEGAERFLFEKEEYANEFLKNVSIIAIELHFDEEENAKILAILENNKFKLQKFGEMYVGVKEQLN
jgi:FkbM family methyltransferase